MAEEKIHECSKIIAQSGYTISFAESATAGWLCSEFALTPESGKVLKGGITCYDASLKESLLGIPHEMIVKYTPESMEVTDQMAMRLKKLIESDIQVAITGLTTPGGSETPEKPVGTMFIAINIRGKLTSIRKVFHGSCEEIIHQTIRAAAEAVTRRLDNE